MLLWPCDWRLQVPYRKDYSRAPLTFAAKGGHTQKHSDPQVPCMSRPVRPGQFKDMYLTKLDSIFLLIFDVGVGGRQEFSSVMVLSQSLKKRHKPSTKALSGVWPELHFDRGFRQNHPTLLFFMLLKPLKIKLEKEKAVKILALFSTLRRDWKISINQKAIKIIIPLCKIICKSAWDWGLCPWCLPYFSGARKPLPAATVQ